jgi:DNA polymerase-3 subunit gamma/tau
VTGSESVPAPAEASSQTAPAVPAPDSEPAADWHATVRGLKLGGMVRELAQHCEMIELTAEQIRLRLPPAHRSLLIHGAPREKLQNALQEHFGRPLRLEIDLGEPATETPAQRRSKEQRERHDRAVQALEQDEFVRDMIDLFDATINESSVKPL